MAYVTLERMRETGSVPRPNHYHRYHPQDVWSHDQQISLLDICQRYGLQAAIRCLSALPADMWRQICLFGCDFALIDLAGNPHALANINAIKSIQNALMSKIPVDIDAIEKGIENSYTEYKTAEYEIAQQFWHSSSVSKVISVYALDTARAHAEDALYDFVDGMMHWTRRDEFPQIAARVEEAFVWHVSKWEMEYAGKTGL